jgi:hypothetical protein
MAYINTSKRTVIVARGIYLWAQIQDYPEGAAPQGLYDTWNEYYRAHPLEADMATKEQYDLFDRVNARF